MTPDQELDRLARDVDSLGWVIAARDAGAAVTTFWESIHTLPFLVRIPVLLAFVNSMFSETTVIETQVVDDWDGDDD